MPASNSISDDGVRKRREICGVAVRYWTAGRAPGEDGGMVTDKMVDAMCRWEDEYLRVGKQLDQRAFMRGVMQAALAAAWVPCAERMPEAGVEVLAWHPLAQDYFLARWNDAEWLETWSGDVLDGEGVTHWMPLPAPPKDDQR